MAQMTREEKIEFRRTAKVGEYYEDGWSTKAKWAVRFPHGWEGVPTKRAAVEASKNALKMQEVSGEGKYLGQIWEVDDVLYGRYFVKDLDGSVKQFKTMEEAKEVSNSVQVYIRNTSYPQPKVPFGEVYHTEKESVPNMDITEMTWCVKGFWDNTGNRPDANIARIRGRLKLQEALDYAKGLQQTRRQMIRSFNTRIGDRVETKSHGIGTIKDVEILCKRYTEEDVRFIIELDDPTRYSMGNPAYHKKELVRI